MHALGQLVLCETGTSARLDYCRRHRKLVLKGIVGLLLFGLLGGPEHPDAKAVGGIAQIGILRRERNG
jgi:hypothetical protein